MKYKIAVTRGSFGTALEFPEVNFKELIKNPVCEDKENAAFFMPYNYNGAGKKSIKDSNGKATGKFVAVDYPTRHKDFITEMTHLCLDVDKNANKFLSKSMDDCQNYEYYLYFSKSATPDNMKFRIILPLEENISIDILQDHSIYKEFIMKLFPYHDAAAAARVGGFFLPNKGEIYRFADNEGHKINILPSFKNFHKQITENKDKEIKEATRKRKRMAKHNMLTTNHSILNRPAIKTYMDEFAVSETGNDGGGQRLLKAYTSAYRANTQGFSQEEIDGAVEVILNHAIHNNLWTYVEAERLRNKSEGIVR
jgi:hypothetical protein